MIKSKEQKDRLKSEQNLRDLWDTIKWTVHTLWYLTRRKGRGNI